jgi:hypothetical protein
MDLRTQLGSVFLGLLIWTLVALAVRRARLYPSYAVLWAFLGLLFVLLPLYADLLRWAAGHLFGIIGANHLVYSILFGFLLVYLFYMTQKICQLTNRVERVIVTLAMLEAQSKAGATVDATLSRGRET